MAPWHDRNYAQLSGVVVDQCPKHGVFFDAGELGQVMAFVRSGGLAVHRERDRRQRDSGSRHARCEHHGLVLTKEVNRSPFWKNELFWVMEVG